MVVTSFDTVYTLGRIGGHPSSTVPQRMETNTTAKEKTPPSQEKGNPYKCFDHGGSLTPGRSNPVEVEVQTAKARCWAH